MQCNLKNALAETAAYLLMALKALCFWRKPPPVTTANHLVYYVESRSKFVAQTTLYGYVRTRAGTRYASLMEDDVFANSVNIAKWEIYLACVCDLAVYAAAQVGRRTGAGNEETGALAIRLVDTAIASEEIPKERPQGFDDIHAAFQQRAKSTAWHGDFKGGEPFEASLDALVEWAPVADELKIYDVEIVKNSMRFKWKKVRDQLNEILDAEAVMTDFRSGAPQETDQGAMPAAEARGHATG